MTRPDPTVLAFDTSAAHCAAALLMGGEIVAERYEEMKKGQAERLFPMLDEVLGEVGAVWAELDAIGVGIGPGNFTGIRIAVSAARGLSMSLGIPSVGVSMFETTQELSRRAQVAVKAPRDASYFMDFDKMRVPVLLPHSDLDAVAFSNEHEVTDHVACIARRAALRLNSRYAIPAPTPLYIRPPDAAPSSDPPPVILP